MSVLLAWALVAAIVAITVRDARRVQTSAARPYQGPEGPVTIPRETLVNPTPTESPSPLLPPDGNWCGCCGRPAPAPWIWCDDCLFHVELGGEKPLHERTWHAQHGTICPYTDLDDDDAAVDDVALRPSRVSPSNTWSAADRALFDEIYERVAR